MSATRFRDVLGPSIIVVGIFIAFALAVDTLLVGSLVVGPGVLYALGAPWEVVLLGLLTLVIGSAVWIILLLRDDRRRRQGTEH